MMEVLAVVVSIYNKGFFGSFGSDYYSHIDTNTMKP